MRALCNGQRPTELLDRVRDRAQLLRRADGTVGLRDQVIGLERANEVWNRPGVAVPREEGSATDGTLVEHSNESSENPIVASLRSDQRHREPGALRDISRRVEGGEEGIQRWLRASRHEISGEEVSLPRRPICGRRVRGPDGVSAAIPVLERETTRTAGA